MIEPLPKVFSICPRALSSACRRPLSSTIVLAIVVDPFSDWAAEPVVPLRRVTVAELTIIVSSLSVNVWFLIGYQVDRQTQGVFGKNLGVKLEAWFWPIY